MRHTTRSDFPDRQSQETKDSLSRKDEYDTSAAAKLRNQKQLRSARVSKIIAIILLFASLSVGLYPFISSALESYRQAHTVKIVHENVEKWPYPEAEEAIKAAKKYNEKLAKSGQAKLGEVSDPFSSHAGSSSVKSSQGDSPSLQDTEYQSLLKEDNSGMMGSVEIPKISVNLPVYHGTTDSILAVGAGHLYGTSLPVGGADTHSVLTGHRGLVDALMFTRLDEMVTGDWFYITSMGETIAYRVDRISVINPEDTKLLRIVPGEDRVTLMTCTPYGINTQRLLVSGVRTHMPYPAPYPEDAPKDKWVIMIQSGLVGLAVFIVGLIVIHIRNAKTKHMPQRAEHQRKR